MKHTEKWHIYNTLNQNTIQGQRCHEHCFDWFYMTWVSFVKCGPLLRGCSPLASGLKYLLLVLHRFSLSPSLFYLWLLPFWLTASELTCCIFTALKPDWCVYDKSIMMCVFILLASCCGDLSVSALGMQKSVLCVLFCKKCLNIWSNVLFPKSVRFWKNV